MPMPHMRCEQRSPGSTQVPQLALQQTLPGAHWVEPHVTTGGAAEAEGAADATGTADALAAEATPAVTLPASAVAAMRAPPSSNSIGGSTWSTMGGGYASGARATSNVASSSLAMVVGALAVALDVTLVTFTLGRVGGSGATVMGRGAC